MVRENSGLPPLQVRAVLIWSLSLSLAFHCCGCAADRTAKPISFNLLFEPYSNDLAPIPAGTAPATLREQALRLYSGQRYDQAQILFDELIRKPANEDLLLFRACNLLALGQHQAALTDLEKISSASRYYHPALWYRALALWQSGRLIASSELLDKYLSLDPEFMKAEAVRLREYLLK